jgi:hypothetical protein
MIAPFHALTSYAIPCNRLPNDIHKACISIPYNTILTHTAVIRRAKPNIPSACLPFDMTYLQKVCGLSPAINKNAYSERQREIIYQEGYPGIFPLPSKNPRSVPYTAKKQYRTLETNIPRKGIARPQSQFPHSCVCERFKYSHNRSAYSAAGNMWTYPGNI